MLRALIAALVLCGPAAARDAPPVVFAAASLAEALSDVATAYEQTGKTKPVFSFASSATLARQIEHGAPAAIFISADEQWMDHVAAHGLIDIASCAALLGNRLVLVAPVAAPLTIKISKGFPLGQALGNGPLAVADPDAVPAGRYAKAALEHFGVWGEVEAKVVRAENVRAALALVARGEAAAGVVYATDAALTRGVAVADTFPEVSHPPIVYPFALLSANASPAAREVFAFMTSEAAAAIYRAHGFIVYAP
jgi:molybdate transport system substrate-binding protein